MPQYKIIVNPISGRGRGAKVAPNIKSMLDRERLSYSMVLTERPWHAAELTQQAIKEGFDVIVAVGGDGTANEVLNGLVEMKKITGQSAAMGVLPIGQGNDFAYGVNIPHGVEAGIQTLAANFRKTIDVGRVIGGLYPQGRYFGNGVGIGFDAVVGFEAAKLKRLRGFISYLIAALKTTFLYFTPPLVQIEYDGQRLIQPSLMVSIMNGTRLGGGFFIAPNANTNDGLFNLCIANYVPKYQIFPLILKFMKGTQAQHHAIKTAQANRVVVTAIEGELPAHADGETVCVDAKQLILDLIPSQIEVICNKKSER